MSRASTCPRCAAPVAAGDVAGLCAACLLELALFDPAGDDTPDEDDAVLPAPAYRVITILGTDADGTTYLAEQPGTRKLVTLSIVALRRPLDDEAREAFRARVAGLKRLSHRAIPPIVDARVTAAGDGCVVAPYVHGPQLSRYCASSDADGATRARLFSGCCDAILHAHAAGVVHGRLGPDSVIVGSSDDNGPSPIVVGFSVFPGEAPPAAVDLQGLAAIARSMGWPGSIDRPWSRIEDLRDTVCREWTASPR